MQATRRTEGLRERLLGREPCGLRGDGPLALRDGEQSLGKARRTFERLGEPSDADDIDAYAHDHGASLAHAVTTVASLIAGEPE
jgi:hypothetical protein